jgi:hypothetical protein
MARFGLGRFTGKKKKKTTDLDRYNEELREKEMKQARETATRRGQVVSQPMTYTRSESMAGRAGRAIQSGYSKLFGKEYDESLRKSKARRKRRRRFDTK